MSKWNYRIGTRINKTLFEQYKNEKLAREYFVFECYYADDGITPDDYFSRIESDDLKPNPLSGWDNYEDLKNTYDMIKSAFDKPIIDIDNFPNEYEKENKCSLLY